MLKVLTRTRRKKMPISLKFDPEDYELARMKAARYTGGNLSWWIRYSCTQLDPKPEDIEEVIDADTVD